MVVMVSRGAAGFGHLIVGRDSSSGRCPFRTDDPLHPIAKIDVTTGKTYVNPDLIQPGAGHRQIVCYFNTRSYWHTAYHPGTNSLYIAYVDNCRDVMYDEAGIAAWKPVRRPGSDPDKWSGHRQGQPDDWRIAAVRRGPDTGNRCGARDCRRADLPWRYQSPLSRVRRGYRRAALGDHPGREPVGEHDQLWGRRTAVHRHHDREQLQGAG